MLSSHLDRVTAAQARFLAPVGGLLRAPGRDCSGLQSAACPLLSPLGPPHTTRAARTGAQPVPGGRPAPEFRACGLGGGAGVLFPEG